MDSSSFSFRERLALACGCGIASFSVIHYFAMKSHIRGDVPLQFGFNGKPRRFVRPSWFAFYPILVAGELCLLYRAAIYASAQQREAASSCEGSSAASSTLAQRLLLKLVGAQDLKSAILAIDVLVLSSAVTAVAQYYAGMVSAGSCIGMPKYLPIALIAGVLAPYGLH